jgi:hypothetical protein
VGCHVIRTNRPSRHCGNAAAPDILRHARQIPPQGHASLGHVFVFAPNGELIARVKSCAGPNCTNVAIGGVKKDRPYITDCASGSVLVADIGVLNS